MNPQDLLGPGAGEGGEMGGMNAGMLPPNVQANLQQMMNNQNNRNNAPQVRVRNQARPPVDHDNLIVEDENAVLEQELIMEHVANQQMPQVEEEEIIINDAGDDEVRGEQNE